MPFEIWNPETSGTTKLWIYGATGTGKTVFSSTAPKPLFLDFEKGMRSIRRPGVARWDINSIRDYKECMRFVAGGEHEFETLVVDSLNVFQRMCQKDVLTTYPAGQNGVGRRSYEMWPNQADWGALLEMFKTFIEAMCTLPYNLILISRTSGAMGVEQRVEPALSGRNTVSDLTGLMDMVGYLHLIQEGDDVVRRMVFDSPKALTKDRTGNLPSYVDNAEWSAIEAAWSMAPQPGVGLEELAANAPIVDEETGEILGYRRDVEGFEKEEERDTVDAIR